MGIYRPERGTGLTRLIWHFAHTSVPDLREIIKTADRETLANLARAFERHNVAGKTKAQIAVVAALYYAYRIGHPKVQLDGMIIELSDEVIDRAEGVLEC